MADRSLLDPRIADNYKPKRTKGVRKRIGITCHKHGFILGDHCPECYQAVKQTMRVNTYDWVKGYWDGIDSEPIYIESKQQLIEECEKRGQYARAFMKPKSRGKGYEHARR